LALGAVMYRSKTNNRSKTMMKLAKTCFIAAVAAGVTLPTMAKSTVAAPKSEKKACAAAKSDLDADAAETMRRMKAIVLPEIAFAPPQTMVDAVEFFRTASKKYDSAEIPEDERGFSFVLKGIVSEDGGTVEYPTLLVFNAKKIPFYDALKLLCDAVGYTFEVCNSIIVVKPEEDVVKLPRP